jgi:hypothetical protein
LEGKAHAQRSDIQWFQQWFQWKEEAVHNRLQLLLWVSKQASDYETTTEFLVNHIKKTYDYGNDIGSALEELEPLNTVQRKPQMKISAESDESIQRVENRQFEIEFQTDYDIYCKRVQNI